MTDRQTDGQTDGIAIAYSALSKLSRAKNPVRIFFSEGVGLGAIQPDPS